MTMSAAPRMALLLAAPALAAVAAAPEGEPVDRQRDLLRSLLNSGCPATAAADEIVVCGRRGDEEQERYRVPADLRIAAPPDRPAGAQLSAMDIDASRCTTVGPHQQCTRGLDMIGIGITLARAVAALIASDDD